jgi:ABC-type Fe3+ transport system, periplasmic component
MGTKEDSGRLLGISKVVRLVGVFTATLALVAGCSTSPEIVKTDPQPKEAVDKSAALVDAAKKEGLLTLYTVASAASAQVQADAFTAKYGIPVNMVRLTGGQMNQRFQAEIDSTAGTPADIVVTEDLPLIKAAMKAGALIPMDKAEIPGYPWNFPEKFLLSDIGTPVTVVFASSIAYNTDLVKGDDVPKGWKDLLDPKWKGKIGVASPSSAMAYVGEWVVIAKQEGGDYLSKLGAQNLKAYAAGATLTGALGAGEIAIAANSLVTNTVPDMKKGAPIKYVVPENTSGIGLSTAIVAKSKHPNAARLFAMYSMSEEGAKVLADAANSASPYDTASIPKGYEAADIGAAPAKFAEVQKLLGVK